MAEFRHVDGLPYRFAQRQILSFIAFLILGLVFPLSGVNEAFAKPRNWKALEIPGARCGDGSRYVAYLEIRDPTKLAIDLMPGGACWNHATCFGPTPMTPMHRLPVVPTLPDGIESTNPAQSPVADHSMLYLPYCTGDVFVSAREVRFPTGFKAFQHGASNIDRTLDVLRFRERFPLEGVKQLVVYGASAGALGAVLNLSRWDALVPRETRRVLIADAPGLHFGERFWNRFADGFREDVALAMEREGMTFPTDGKPIAGQLASLCAKNPDWRVGVLQGDLDIAMSGIFGSINPWRHRDLVYGPWGLLNTMRNAPGNCSTWIHPSPMHMFALTGATARMHVGKKTARAFIDDLVNSDEKLIFAPDGR